MTRSNSLHEALDLLGIVAMRDGRTPADQKLTWYSADGLTLGRFDAHEGWAKLKELTARVEAERAA